MSLSTIATKLPVALIICSIQLFFGLIAFSCIFGAVGSQYVWSDQATAAALLNVLAWLWSMGLVLATLLGTKVQMEKASPVVVLLIVDVLLLIFLLAASILLGTSAIDSICNKHDYELVYSVYTYSCHTHKTSIAFSVLNMLMFLGSIAWTIIENKTDLFTAPPQEQATTQQEPYVAIHEAPQASTEQV